MGDKENCENEETRENFLPTDNETNGSGTNTGSCNGCKKHQGFLFAMCSGFLYASVGLIVKQLSGYHVFNLGVFRFTGMLIPALLFIICTQIINKKKEQKFCKDNDGDKGQERRESLFHLIWPPTEPKKLKMLAVLFGRGFIGFGAIICFFVSIQYLPVADAVVIGSCSTVFVAVIAHVFLGEKCGVFPILSAILTVIGVGIIVKPPFLTGEESFNQNLLVGTGFALGRMLFTTVAIVFVRYLRSLDASLVVVVIGFIQLVQSAGAGLALGVLSLPNSTKDWVLLVTLGIFSWGAQMSFTMALKSEQAATFTIVRTSSDAVFAFLLQFLFLGYVPDVYSVAGAVVIMSAVGLTVIRKWISSLPEEDESRKKYSFILK